MDVLELGFQAELKERDDGSLILSGFTGLTADWSGLLGDSGRVFPLEAKVIPKSLREGLETLAQKLKGRADGAIERVAVSLEARPVALLLQNTSPLSRSKAVTKLIGLALSWPCSEPSQSARAIRQFRLAYTVVQFSAAIATVRVFAY